MLRCPVCTDLFRSFRIHGTCPLGFPIQLPPRIRHPIVLIHGAPHTLGNVCRMGGNLRRHDALLHILEIRQRQMLRRCHIAEEGRAICRCNGTTDGCGNVIIARCNVGHQRPQGIERRTLTDGLLDLHIGSNLVHGHMSRSLDHHLHISVPCTLGQLAERHQLLNLADICGIGQAAGTAGITERNGYIVFPTDLQNLIKVRQEGILLSRHAHPGKNKRTASGYNIHFPVAVTNLVDGLPADAAVQGHKIYTILGMQSYHINKVLGRQGVQIPLVMDHGIIDRHCADHGRAF